MVREGGSLARAYTHAHTHTCTHKHTNTDTRTQHSSTPRQTLLAFNVIAFSFCCWHPGARLAVGPVFEPGGAVFAVYVLLVCSSAAGAAVARFPPMPALVGQLLVGFLLRNLPGVGPAVVGGCTS
jgi:hypothetical protein